MIDFEFGEPFTISQGEKVTDRYLTIQFDRVSYDSRCPQGMPCDWDGRIDCVFTLEEKGASKSVTVSSGDLSQGGTDQAYFNGYIIKLNNIAPLRTVDEEIAQKDYDATLKVTHYSMMF